MNKQKIPYEVPEAQTFVVRCEGVVCQSPNGVVTTNGRKSYTYYDLDEEED